jgi:DNA-binding FadR family transcriptional regulator
MINTGPFDRQLRSSRRGLHRDVVEALGRPIVRGDRRPDELLPNEAQLSLELEVSRTVVREAIKVLASMGLVEVRPKTGTRVLPRSFWRLIDPDVLRWQFDDEVDEHLYHEISEVRLMIEPRAAALASSRRSAAESEEIARLLSVMSATTHDPMAYIQADIAFHSAILQATHNDLLAQMAGTIHTALVASRKVTVRVPGGPARAMPHHHAVGEAIIAGQAPKAARAMERLVKATWSDVVSILHDGRAPAAPNDRADRGQSSRLEGPGIEPGH